MLSVEIKIINKIYHKNPANTVYVNRKVLELI